MLEVNSLTHFPLVGIGLPSVMEKVDKLLRRCGMPPTEPIDRTCSPVYSMPLDMLLKRCRPENLSTLPDFGLLHAETMLDGETTQAMADAILLAESALIETSGSLELFEAWSSTNFLFYPGLEYVLPVACRALGREDDVRSHIDQYRVHIQAMGNQAYADIYERFVAELDRELAANGL